MLTSQHASFFCHHVEDVKWVISHVNMQNSDSNMGPPFPDAVTGMLVGPLLSIPPSVLPLTNLGMDGNTHGSSARHGSLAQSLYSKHQTNPWRPYPQAASQTEATRRPKAPQGAMSNMPGSSQDLKVPNAGPDPQRTTIQGPIVYSYSSKLQTNDVTPKSP